MKIDISEVRIIEDLLNDLRKQQSTLAFLNEDREPRNRTLWHTSIIGDIEITHEELSNIFNARIDATLKTLAQRYHIEFNRTSAAPVASKAATENNGGRDDMTGGHGGQIIDVTR